jgi:putative aminopeptidase FrvX
MITGFFIGASHFMQNFMRKDLVNRIRIDPHFLFFRSALTSSRTSPTLEKPTTEVSMQSTLSLLQQLTGASGISGHEKPVREILIREISAFADPVTDRMGSVSFTAGTSRPKLLFLAHMDEIGFIVSDICDNGTLKLQKVGGWDPSTLQSSPVEITNTHGEKLFGVIGSTPVHYQKDGGGKLDVEDLFVDIGSGSKTETMEHFAVRLGSPITPISHFIHSEKNNRVFAKAFDDRIGCCVIAELGRTIDPKTLSNTVVLTGGVQEELGLRGASVLANYTDADLAIILEGPPADDLIKPRPQCACGKGVHIRVFDPTMMTPPALLDFVTNLAVKNNIPYQLTVRSSGGTDAGRIHLAGKGVPSIVLGVPVRYAHSHIGCISMDDYQAMLQLCQAIIAALDETALKGILA